MLKYLLDILGSLERFLDRRRESATRRSAAHKKAIESALDALNETSRYLFDRVEGAARDSAREGELAKRWARAAVDVHAVDRRLSRLALLESFAWADPRLLEDARYENVIDRLELARRQCEWLLEHW